MALIFPSIALLLVISVGGSRGCFPIDEVFNGNTLWSQNLRKPWQRWYTIGQDTDANMAIETDSAKHRRKADVTCITKYTGHRYLVRVEEQDKPTKYGCLQFTPLSAQVVRRAKTKLHKDRMKVNCQHDVYTEEDAIMIAYHKMSPEACPLLGGYQLIVHEGVTVRGHCLDTIQTYNPKLEFGCGGDHVIADFGQDCAPTLSAKNQSLYQIPFAHLQCVGSWKETGGKVMAVLLQMMSEPSTFWCMHYTPVRGDDNKLLKIYVSFDAKCSANAFNNDRDMPDSNSMFGRLAQYVPTSDKRCFENSYIKKCRYSESPCFESNDCPLDCQRCNMKIPKRSCDFKDAVGHWNTVDKSRDLTVDIKSNGFKVTGHGTFSCVSSLGSKPQGGLYAVVRNDPYSSCLPFFACAKIFSPAPGILNFFLRPAARHSQSGKPLSCAKNPDGLPTIVPAGNDEAILLLNRNALSKVPCNIPRDLMFPSSLGKCRFVLKQCTGTCATLYGDYDTASCGNTTTFDIEHEHVCHASLRLTDNIRALLTSSVGNERVLCWIYTSHRLFVTIPEHCNDEGVKRIFSDKKAQSRYDPFLGISLPQKVRVVGHGGGASRTCNSSQWGVIVLLSLILLQV